ncbi:MAG: HNH endonuclease [Brachybacterium sp.]|nr:HNH endonuclease [Brachybacterium sp.]
MTSSPRVPGPEGEFSPQALLDGLREQGPAALSEALGDLAHLLQEIAGDPGEAFALEGRARREFTTLLGNLQACASAMEALEARSVIALRDITRRDRHASTRDRAAHEAGAEPSRTAVEEVADSATKDDLSLITRRSPHMAGRTLASAQRLVEVLPRMMDALRMGKISSDAAYAVAGAASVLTPDLARDVDRRLDERLPEFDGAGTRRWADAVATIAGELDPEGATLRHRRALRERRVTMRPGQHGMATLSARLSAIDAARIHKRFSLEAERRRAAGAREGHGAVMADALTDTLLGRDENAAPGILDIGLIITDRALFRPDAGDTAHLEGYGPVPAEAVRQQLRAATSEPADPAEDPYGADGPAVRAELRRLYTHPITGELVAMDSTARAFPPAMRRFLTWRDTTCRGPHCNAAIRQSDHIDPVSRGGPTSLDNGQGLCGHCNKKETSAANVERIEDSDGSGHRVEWTGHSGTSRISTPTPLHWPYRPGPGDPPTGGTPAEDPSADDAPVDDVPGSARRIIPRRPRRAAAPPPPPPPAPRPPGRSGRATSAVPEVGPVRRVPPSGRRRDRAEPADDPDH